MAITLHVELCDAMENYSFINCESPYSEFVEAAYRERTEAGRDLMISFLRQYLNFVVCSKEFAWSDENDEASSAENDALNAVRYCLSDPICQEQIWKWYEPLLHTERMETQGAFAVLVLCPILGGLIPWDDPGEMFAVEHVFGCYRNPETKWVVLEGFTEGSFEDAMRTIKQYNTWCEAQRKQPLILDRGDWDELRSYMMEYGVEDEGEKRG